MGRERDGQREDELEGSARRGEMLSFPRRDAEESEAGMEPRDPVAHPVYRPRVDGAAHPIYQLCEEPMRVPEAAKEPVVSPKMELDIACFLEALNSAFPHPRDPLVRPVLRARPARAARPFLYRGRMEDAGVVPEAKAAEAPRETLKVDAPYDPILDPNAEALLPQRERAVETRSELAAGTETRRRVWAQQAGEMRERGEAEAIELADPVAKPRLPMAPAALPKRLSPSQRAALQRPAVVLDRDGRPAEVTYRVESAGRG